MGPELDVDPRRAAQRFIDTFPSDTETSKEANSLSRKKHHDSRHTV